MSDAPVFLARLLASASRLQSVVPDAVLVGGSAAAYYARHRLSFDHDHVLRDLTERYDQVLEAVEATELGGIEAGLRQLRRTRPLEVAEVEVPGAGRLRVPTEEEILRVKAYLVVLRNQVRDYLDVVALAERVGLDSATETLSAIDDYYADRSGGDDSVLTSLVQRLSEPSPRDSRVTAQLASYKGLDPRWHDWAQVVSACAALADHLVDRVGGD